VRGDTFGDQSNIVPGYYGPPTKEELAKASKDLISKFNREALARAVPPRILVDQLMCVDRPCGIKYIRCGDGTLIDLKHFLTAAGIAQWFNKEFFTGGEVASNCAMWVCECAQWTWEKTFGKGDSGAPFGGNEDLTSNAAGADFGDEHLSDIGSLGQQIAQYLKVYGGVHSIQ
jgi:hypothetical protein